MSDHRIGRRNALKLTGMMAVGAGAVTSGTASEGSPTASDVDTDDVTDSDWTMWRFNRSNTGLNPHAFGATTFSDTWVYDEATDRTLYSPAVSDGVAYFGAFDSRMHAVDVTAGEQLWTADAGGIIQSTPTILDGVVYSAAYDGEIYAWDADTGEEIWNVVGGGAGDRTTSVTVDSEGETIFVGSDDAVYSLVPETGDINWEFPTSDNLTASPSIADGIAYQGDWSGQFYAIDTETGEEVWNRQLGSDVRSTAAIVDGVLYVGVFNGSGTSTADSLTEREGPPLDYRDQSADSPAPSGQPTGVYALDATTGDTIWSSEMDTVFSSPVVAEGLVFAVDYSGTFVAFDRTSGDLVWSHQFDADPGASSPTASPAYADGVVYSGSGPLESSLFAFDAQSGDVLEEFDIGGESVLSPAITEENVYVTARDSNENAELLGYVTDIETRSVVGAVAGPDEEPVETAELVLFPRYQEGYALQLLAEYPTHPDPSEVLEVEATAETGSDGEYSLTGIETGDYHILVLPTPGSDYTPQLAEDVIVDEDDTERDITLAQNRPLAELDDTMADLLGPPSGADQGALGTHLETITVQTAEVTDEGVEEFPSKEEITSLFDVSGSALDYELDQPKEEFEEQLTADILEAGLDVAEQGLDKALGIVWDQLNPEIQGQLTDVNDALSAESWFSDLEYPSREWLITQGYMLSPLYLDALDAVDEARTEYDGIAVQDPHEEFSMSAAKTAIDEVRLQVENPEYGVPGFVVLPDGRSFDIDQSESYAVAFEGTRNRIDDIETGQTLAQAGKVVGGALVLTGKGAPVGAKLMKVSASGYKKAEFAATIARFKLAVEAVLTNIYWGIDTTRTASLAAETVTWLDDARQGPLHEADIEIVDTDLSLSESSVPFWPDYVHANQPPPADVPDWLPIDGIGIQTKAVYDGEITLKNHSEQSQQFELTMYSQYDEGAAISNEGSAHPAPGEVAEIGPGEEKTVELEWISDFRLSGILNWYTMVIQVWSGGVLRDDEDVVYEVRPSIEIEGERGATPVRTARMAVTSADKRHDEPLTVAELDEYRARTETILETTVDTDAPTVSTQVTAADDTNRFTFMLSATSGVALQVFDEQGRLVGYDPSIDEVRTQIPEARYVGPDATPQIVALDTEPGRTYTVEVVGYRFRDTTEKRVAVHTVDTPDREALLSVSPDQVATVVTPGESHTAEFHIAEVGDQVDIEDVSLDPGPLENDEGETLDGVDLNPTESDFDVPAGDTRMTDITVEATEEIDLPGTAEQTRFEADVTVETANAGSLESSLSALVLDTDLADVSLVEAATSVDGIGISDADRDQFEPDRPQYVTLTDAYDLSVSGEGTVTLQIPDPEPGSRLFAFAVGEGWTNLETGRVEGEMRVSLDASLDADHLVVGIAPPVVVDARPKDLTGDGLFEDVDGDGEFTIFDVQALFDALGEGRVHTYPEAFNFNDDEDPEEVTIFDVQGLFNRLSEWDDP